MTVDRKPRIGFYCPGTGTGGPWRYVHSLLAGLDPAEWNVTVFCDIVGPYAPRPATRVVPLAAPVVPHLAGTPTPPPLPRTRRRLPMPAGARVVAGYAHAARRLARLLRDHPVDVLHTQNTGCEESPIAARLAGVPHVVGTFHVDSTYDLRRERSGPGPRLVEVVSNRCLHAAIAVSEATKRDWVRRSFFPADRVVTIHNGIDAEKFRRRESRAEARRRLGLPTDATIVAGLGRLDEAKGFAYLVDAAGALQSDYPDLVVAIAGAGPLELSLRERATCLGGSARLLGFQSDVQLLLDAADVFALPSLCEALPYALLEAMATELPAVASAVGGVSEVIVPGETGFLVPPRDAGALAAALRPLLASAELRAKFGAAGRERVARHFREDEMVRQTLQLYHNLWPGTPRQARP